LTGPQSLVSWRYRELVGRLQTMPRLSPRATSWGCGSRKCAPAFALLGMGVGAFAVTVSTTR
jgi:hypothetical protein